MSRRHDQQPDRAIDVRRRDDIPEQFLWRGRLYRVRAVLERWNECGPWWDSAARRRRPEDANSTPAWARRVWDEPVSAAAVEPVISLEEEREFWRVEADAGASSRRGVYDLCLDVERGQWSLSAVQD